MSSVTVLSKCRQRWATVCGQWLLTEVVLSLPRLWCSRQGGRGALAAQLNFVFIALLWSGSIAAEWRRMEKWGDDACCHCRKTCGHHELAVVCPLCAADAGEMLLYWDRCCSLQLKWRQIVLVSSTGVVCPEACCGWAGFLFYVMEGKMEAQLQICWVTLISKLLSNTVGRSAFPFFWYFKKQWFWC